MIANSSNAGTTETQVNTGTFASFLKLKWRTSTTKDPKLNIKQRVPNSVDDIERDWVRHSALKLAFEGDFKAPIQRLLQAGGSEVLDIGCGAGFWTLDMAARFPISYFTGIDVDKNVLPKTNPQPRNVLYQKIDLVELPLPYEDATFDYIFIRSMIDTLPDALWDDVLKELARIMKKGAYIECVEAYDNLFDAGPSMNTLTQLIQNSTQQAPETPPTPTTPTTTSYTNITSIKPNNPWPNRIANMSQFMGMQIYHTHTPVGLYGGEIGSLLLEYWERIIKRYRRDWISQKLIGEDQLEKTVEAMRDEVNEYNTYMSWYSVVAQKRGYNGPTLQFDDVDDFDTVHTTIF